jgi:hypothetical protein
MQKNYHNFSIVSKQINSWSIVLLAWNEPELRMSRVLRWLQHEWARPKLRHRMERCVYSCEFCITHFIRVAVSATLGIVERSIFLKNSFRVKLKFKNFGSLLLSRLNFFLLFFNLYYNHSLNYSRWIPISYHLILIESKNLFDLV